VKTHPHRDGLQRFTSWTASDRYAGVISESLMLTLTPNRNRITNMYATPVFHSYRHRHSNTTIDTTKTSPDQDSPCRLPASTRLPILPTRLHLLLRSRPYRFVPLPCGKGSWVLVGVFVRAVDEEERE
jgi:hypothetical protein